MAVSNVTATGTETTQRAEHAGDVQPATAGAVSDASAAATGPDSMRPAGSVVTPPKFYVPIPERKPGDLSDLVSTAMGFAFTVAVLVTFGAMLVGVNTPPFGGPWPWIILGVAVWAVAVGWSREAKSARVMFLAGVGALGYTGFVVGLVIEAANLSWLAQLSLISATSMVLAIAPTIVFPRLPGSRGWWLISLVVGMAAAAIMVLLREPIFGYLGFPMGDPGRVAAGVNLAIVLLSDAALFCFWSDEYQGFVATSPYNHDDEVGEWMWLAMTPFAVFVNLSTD